MAGVENIFNIEQLKPFMNEKGIIEIAMRDRRKKFSAFQKISISNLTENANQSLLKKAVEQLNSHTSLLKDSMNMLNKVANLQKLSVILNGVNLCATCAGFAIMYAKLDKISGQISQLMSVVKQGHDVQTAFEFKKVLSEHANMLDSRKRQKCYTEEQMRKLVDDEYNVLSMLIDVANRDLVEDSENLIVSIFALAAMLAVALRYFDELYYFQNKEAIGDGDKWHSSHETWMAVFDKLTEDSFIKKLQDHAIFDLDYSTEEADIYYINLYDQVMEMKETIRDNQTLIETMDDQEALNAYVEYIQEDASSEIKKAFDETKGAMDDPEIVKAYQSAMKQVGLA